LFSYISSWNSLSAKICEKNCFCAFFWLRHCFLGFRTGSEGDSNSETISWLFLMFRAGKQCLVGKTSRRIRFSHFQLASRNDSYSNQLSIFSTLAYGSYKCKTWTENAKIGLYEVFYLLGTVFPLWTSRTIKKLIRDLSHLHFQHEILENSDEVKKRRKNSFLRISWQRVNFMSWCKRTICREFQALSDSIIVHMSNSYFAEKFEVEIFAEMRSGWSLTLYKTSINAVGCWAKRGTRSAWSWRVFLAQNIFGPATFV